MLDKPADPSPTRPSIRHALTDGWALARPFWRAPSERRAWALLAAVVALTLGTVALNVRFSTWNNSFYNTLQNHDLAGFWRQLGVFGALAAVFIVVAVYRQYLQQLLFMRWRTWLTRHLLEGWLHPGAAYRLGARTADRIDNPDQRIAEDARGFDAVTCLERRDVAKKNSCFVSISRVPIRRGGRASVENRSGPSAARFPNQGRDDDAIHGDGQSRQELGGGSSPG